MWFIHKVPLGRKFPGDVNRDSYERVDFFVHNADQESILEQHSIAIAFVFRRTNFNVDKGASVQREQVVGPRSVAITLVVLLRNPCHECQGPIPLTGRSAPSREPKQGHIPLKFRALEIGFMQMRRNGSKERVVGSVFDLVLVQW